MSSAFPIAPDQETMRRLVVVREVFESAVSRSSLDNRSARVVSVIDFDFAIETMLRLVHRALTGHSPDKGKGLSGVLREVSKFLAAEVGSGVSESAEMERMHEIRNGVQHHAEYPTAEQVTRIRASAGICIDVTLRSVWGIGLFDIDEVDAVSSDQAREHLKTASALLAGGDAEPNKVLGLCWLSLSSVVDKVREDFIGRTPRHGAELITSQPFNEIGESPGLMSALVRTQDLILVQALGVDPVQYGRFLSLTRGFVTSMGRDEPDRMMGIDTEVPTLEVARFVYTFSVQAIIQIEARIGPVENHDFWRLPRFH
jgi:hypothetical protein